jgi:anthranilate/para-aminobenzoate synthase component II
MDRDQMQLKSKWYVQNIERQDELAIEHNQKGAFNRIVNPLPVARYHSLVAKKMPSNFF